MVTMYEARKMTIPELHPEHQAYWDAASEGKLLLKRCTQCDEIHYYPRVLCPYCMSEKIEWIEAMGKGEIYTYSVMRHGTPYAIAFVELEEGVRMMTNIVDCDLDSVHIGQKVYVVFKESGDEEQSGAFVPCFTPFTD